MSYLFKLQPKAIILGYLANIIALMGVGIVTLPLLFVPKILQGAHTVEDFNVLPFWLQIIYFIVGLVCAVFGGWITARVAQINPVENAIGFGSISFILTVIWGIISSKDMLWYDFISSIMVLPAACLGGYLWKQKQQVVNND